VIDSAAQRARRDRRLGWLVVAVGGVLALAVQTAAPVGVPLFDGVSVVEPYRFLHPTGDQAGSPTSFASMPAVTGSESPQFVAATTESPPQAQVIAMKGAFELTAGATALKVEITPIEPPAVPLVGAIAGNAYRFSVTDQSGQPLRIKPCQGCISLVLRVPDGTGDAAIKRFSDGAWQDVDTIHAGITGTYQTNPTALGDMAVIAGAPVGPAVDPLLVGGGVALLAVVGIIAFILFRFQPTPRPPTRGSAAPIPKRVPSKKRSPRRPPPGRPNQ
jgi:hypothetical protein